MSHKKGYVTLGASLLMLCAVMILVSCMTYVRTLPNSQEFIEASLQTTNTSHIDFTPIANKIYTLDDAATKLTSVDSSLTKANFASLFTNPKIVLTSVTVSTSATPHTVDIKYTVTTNSGTIYAKVSVCDIIYSYTWATTPPQPILVSYTVK